MKKEAKFDTDLLRKALANAYTQRLQAASIVPPQQSEMTAMSKAEQYVRREVAEEAELFHSMEEEEQYQLELGNLIMEAWLSVREERKSEEVFRAGPWC